jgi:acetoin utilization protein AcuB
MKLIKDIMSREVISVDSNTSIMVALGRMIEHGIHHLPVVDDGVLRGIISDRDIREFALPTTDEYRELSSQHVSLDAAVFTIMDPEVRTIAPSASIVDAIDMLLDYSIDAITVVDPNNHGIVLGIVSYEDVLRTARVELSVRA